MNSKILFLTSIKSLAKHKVRSFLTILGIIVGIGAIISTLAIGKGAEERAKQQFLAMGDNYIETFAGNWFQEGKTSASKRKRVPFLRFKDVETISKLCPMVKNISPFSSTKDIVTHEGNNSYVPIKGGNENTLKILNRKIRIGTFFNQNQAYLGSRVVVLGYAAAKDLFKTINPIGKMVKIKNSFFKVIGVVESMENYRGIHDPNLDIFIPIKAYKKNINNEKNQVIGSIIISSPTRELMPYIVRRIKNILRFRRKVKKDDPDDFTVVDQSLIIKAAQGVAETVKLLLLIIASISLFVGGIGIMNIMLVSVTERRREIGIRMAIGANKKMLMQQFLFESLVLCLVGGAIGTSIGAAVPVLVAYFTSWKPIVTLNSVLVATITTCSIGIFFGLYPARKAANLNPVDALSER